MLRKTGRSGDRIFPSVRGGVVYFEEIITNFDVKKRYPNRVQAICPAHQDKEASLTISRGVGKTLVYCHAGCTCAAVVGAVGLTPADLFDDKSDAPDWIRYVEKVKGRSAESIYHYHDLSGRYAFTRLRLSGKVFCYGILKDGRFGFGLNGKSRRDIPAVYGDVAKIRKAERIFYCEGEKDVNTVNTFGLCGVTCGSSGDWVGECRDLFKDKEVIILQDNDSSGKKLSEAVSKDLKEVAQSVTVVVPTPELDKGDISDFMENHTVEDLEQLIRQAKSKQAEEDPGQAIFSGAEAPDPEEPLTEGQALEVSRANPLDLEITKQGKVANTFGNYCEIVSQDAYLKDKLKMNALDGRVVVSGAFWDMAAHPIRDVDLFQIRKYVGNVYGVSNAENIRQAIELTASEHMIHPIKDILSGLRWDGVSRIPELFPRYLGADRSEYTTAVTTLLLHGAVQRVFNPGVKFDLCIILSDKMQGSGKSSLCRFLAIKDEWFCDALGDMGDTKKAYEAIRGHWICELGEMLATRRSKDVESIKAYLSRTADDYRQPYGTYTERRPRQCVFIGTSNKPQFLPDDKTGNRRFIPLRCDGRKAIVHPMENEQETRDYILQCYAEAMELGRREGWALTLDRKFDAELTRIREESTPEDPRIGIIQEYLDNTKKDIVCSYLIFDEVLNPDNRIPTTYELQAISDIMNLSIRGWERYRGKDGRGTSGKYRFKEIRAAGRYNSPRAIGSQLAWRRTDSF